MRQAGEPPVRLKRGGAVLLTEAGPVQVGSPPETIKDTMRLKFGVPAVYILPQKLYRPEWGVSLAELEFPVYFNFFVLKRKTVVVCERSQRVRAEEVLRESVFGPEAIDLTMDYARDTVPFGLPDLKREMDHFRKNPFKKGELMQLEDLVTFVELPIDEERRVLPDKDIRVKLGKTSVRVRDGSRAWVLDESMLAPVIDPPPDTPTSFEPPLFGVTCLGASHGFDSLEPTSGFILWVNNRGIMVDPPIHSTRVLESFNINPKHIHALLLTHCHADHDAGVLQKCFQESKISLYTTPTIFKSFIRKAVALTQLPAIRLYDLFDFHPLSIGRPNRIGGAEVICNYSLHSIPTIGFQVFFEGNSMVYSSDTLYDPDAIRKMHEEGVMSRDRMASLLDFPWHLDLIFHEAGVPPLHTPASVLAKLPADVKKRLRLLHTDMRDIPADSGLKRADKGVENTMSLPVRPSYRTEAVKTLDVLANVDLFAGFPVDKAKEFLAMAKVETYKPGAAILLAKHSDAEPERFYIVMSGQVELRFSGKTIVYDAYDYFGQTSILLNQHRRSDLYARTDVQLLSLSAHDFLHFIRGSAVGPQLTRLAQVRSTGSWDLLSSGRIFSTLSTTQKTQLERILEPRDFSPGRHLLKAGAVPSAAFIIRRGKVAVRRGKKIIAKLSPGDFAGDVPSLSAGSASPLCFAAMSHVEAYQIDGKDLMDFLNHNPGVQYRLMDRDYVLGVKGSRRLRTR
ncbi:cyclic nucleotide-binding domain-containing protein [bacterium]|nr:cyclic nucleotide-binding domain-containing protein [bacterium]